MNLLFLKSFLGSRHHTRLIEEAHESGSEEDLVLIDENIRLNPDGTLEEV